MRLKEMNAVAAGGDCACDAGDALTHYDDATEGQLGSQVAK